MAIRNHKLQQKGPKLSRTDKWRRNPIPWIVLLFITSGIAWYSIYPMATDYFQKKIKVNKFEEENPKLEKKQENLQIDFDEVKADFDEAASEIKAKEKQIFPETIDTAKVVKILELFSLILDYDIDGSSAFSLDSVNFSSSQVTEEGDYAVLKANVKAIGTKKNINDFVDFLKTGEIPKDQIKKLAGESDLTVDLEFLKQNLLPLARLDSLRINKHNSTDSSISDLLSVELQINFYSQK